MGRKEFMLGQLEKHDIVYKVRGNNILVKCPFHRHSGRKFKLSIHEMGKPIHCWVCKISGTWNDYAQRMGLEEIDFRKGHTIDDFLEIERQLVEREPNRVQLPRGIELWTGPMPRNGKGPDIPESILADIPSFRWYDAKSKSYRILFDVTIHKKRVGWIGYTIDDSTFPKVRNMAGNWANKALFPYDHPLNAGSTVLVLVEGPTDALRLIAEGIPSVAILGTGSWTEATKNLVAIHGAKKIVVLMDGDREGTAASRKIASDCREFANTINILLPNEVDPGNASAKIIKKLKRKILE